MRPIRLNVYGRLGYELYPATMSGHRLGRWINTAAAHNAHYAQGRYNHGYYFLVRDRLMGTVEPQPGSKQSVKTASTAG